MQHNLGGGGREDTEDLLVGSAPELRSYPFSPTPEEKKQYRRLSVSSPHNEFPTEKSASWTNQVSQDNNDAVVERAFRPAKRIQFIDDEEDELDLESTPNNRRRLASCWKEATDPNGRTFRMILLVLFCATAFGHMFNYDSPSALVEYLKAELNLDEFWYDWFYSIYSWPNVIMAVVGGIIVDTLGRRFGVLLFAALVLSGQCVFAIGSTFNNYWVMLGGRFIFGVGSESLTLTIDYMVSYWFFGNEVVMAMGILLANEAMSDWSNFIITPVIASEWNPKLTPWFGCCISCVSMCAAVLVASLDKWGQNKLDEEEANEMSDLSIQEPIHEEEEEPPFRISDLLKLPLGYWLWVCAMVFYYSCSFPFVAVAGDWIHDTWGFTPEAASWTTSLYSFAAIFFAPALGLLLDYIGGLGYAGVAGPLATVLLFVACGFTGNHIPPYVIMLLMGVLYSCAAALQGGVPRLVDARYVGTAYGIAYSAMNLVLAVMTLGVGEVQAKYGWTITGFLFVGAGSLSFMGAIGANVLDRWNKGKLNLSKARLHHMALHEAATPVSVAPDEQTLLPHISIRGKPTEHSH